MLSVRGLLTSPLVIFFVALGAFIFCKFLTKPSNDNKSTSGPNSEKARATLTFEFRNWSMEDLRECDGVRSSRICLVADGRVFDVSKAPQHYGPGGSYHALAGRDASRAFASHSIPSLAPDEIQSYDNYTDLTSKERDILNGWVEFLESKYTQIGTLSKSKLPLGETETILP